jgi:hypothetical protein
MINFLVPHIIVLSIDMTFGVWLLNSQDWADIARSSL